MKVEAINNKKKIKEYKQELYNKAKTNDYDYLK